MTKLSDNGVALALGAVALVEGIAWWQSRRGSFAPFDLEAQLGLSSPTEEKEKGKKVVYEVYGIEKKVLKFDSKEDLLARFEQKGVIKHIKGQLIPLLPVLYGQPYLKGLVGPMMDKETRDKIVIRYETQDLYDRNWP